MKYIKLSLMALALMGITTSCFKMEEEDIFDENAATRLDNAIKNYTDILTQGNGKWVLEYFSNNEETEPGYVYVLTFNKNGSVTFSGKNELIGELSGQQFTQVFGSDNSAWEVIGDNGPVLSFNTYNKVFHLFADPEDIASTETSEQGYGHRGDYEFDIMKYSGDTLYIDGKKYENHMILTRLSDAYESDEAYFEALDEYRDNTFTTLIPELYLTDSNGKRYVCTGANSMVWSIYPEGGDAITETQTFGACFTPGSIRFMNPLSIITQNGGAPAQEFKLEGDKLVSRDGKTTITSAPYGEIFADIRFKWQVDPATSSGALLDAYNALATDIKSVNSSTLQTIQFTTAYVDGVRHYSMLYNVRARINNRNTNLKLNLYNELTPQGNGIKFHFTGEGDALALNYLERVQAMSNLVSMLENGNLELATDLPLGPKVMRIVDKNDSNSYLTIKFI